MKRTGRWAFLITIMLTIGCQHVGIGLPTAGDKSQETVVPDSVLKERIKSLEQLLEEQELTSQEKQIASSLAETYKSLRDLSSGHKYRKGEQKEIIRKLFQTLTTLEGIYFSDKGPQGRKTYMDLLEEREKSIIDSYNWYDYKSVIAKCKKLKKEFGSQALDVEVGFILALSLAKEGMLEEAICTAREMVSRYERSIYALNLLVHITQWQLKLGKREEAFITYKKLNTELENIQSKVSTLSEKFLTLPVDSTERRPDTLTKTDREYHRAGSEAQSEEPFLSKIRRLIKERHFSEARNVLALKREKVEPGSSEARAVEKAYQEVEEAEEAFIEDRLASISRKKETINTARELLKQEKFEEVLQDLERLEERNLGGPETKVLKRRAMEKLIKQERNRAAKLFLAGKQAKSPEEKRINFKECYNILKTLIEKYPSSPLIKRLKMDAKKVKQELEKL